MVVNIRQIIAQAMERHSKRNLWRVFGYPSAVTLDEYWLRYRRGGIATRIIRSYPDACWFGTPLVQDEQGSSPDPTSDEYSPFTEAFNNLNESLSVVSYLSRVDRLSRVGHYAVLFMGFAGDTDLSKPVSGNSQLLYLSAYGERSAKITKWVTDPKDERFGLPEMYSLTSQQSEGSGGATGRAILVHHSRVIHVAENCDEGEVFGEPALRPVWNYLLDLEKVIGSGAETFWLNARGGLSVEAQADAKLDDKSIADMKKQIDDYENDLRRVLALQGASVKAIGLTTSDPRGNVDVSVQMICGTTGIPQRLLTGSERGELSSSEDANSWEARVGERRKDHCGPRILKPFLQAMIDTGNLPAPSGRVDHGWPETSSMSPEKQATVANQRLTAASTWANGQADRIVSIEEARIMIGLPPTSEYDLEEEEETNDPPLGPDGLPLTTVVDDPEDDPDGEDEKPSGET